MSLQINILLLKTKDTKDYNYSMICQGYGLLGLYDFTLVKGDVYFYDNPLYDLS